MRRIWLRRSRGPSYRRRGPRRLRRLRRRWRWPRSRLLEALRYEGPEMPPEGKLPDEVIADFATWIRMGAPDPRTGPVRQGPINYVEARKYWAFQPPKKHAPPAVQDTAWARSEIDQ